MLNHIAPKIRTEVTFGKGDIRFESGYQILEDGTKTPVLVLVQYETKEECDADIEAHTTPDPDVVFVFPTDETIDIFVMALMRLKEAVLANRGVTGEVISVTIKEVVAE